MAKTKSIECIINNTLVLPYIEVKCQDLSNVVKSCFPRIS